MRKIISTQILLDGILLHTFVGEKSQRDAWIKMLQIQPNSVGYAIRNAGYSVVERWSDGSTEKW